MSSVAKVNVANRDCFWVIRQSEQIFVHSQSLKIFHLLLVFGIPDENLFKLR